MAMAPRVYRPHAAAARKRRDDSSRESAQNRGYDALWHKLRGVKVKCDPLCQDCEERGDSVPVAEVDHIIPITGLNDPLRLDVENLRSRCKACHARKTRLDDRLRGLFDKLLNENVGYDRARDIVTSMEQKERA